MTKLADPFPTKPSDTKFHIYAMRHFPGEVHRRLFTVAFHSCYAAKRWLEIMMGDETATRIGYELNLESGVKLRTFELDTILSYEYANDSEANWRLPDSYALMIARFRRGIWFAEPKAVEAAVKASPDIRATIKVTTTNKVAIPDGYVRVVDLVKGTSVKPMDARSILRSSMTKPDYGWAFAPDKLPEIRKLIGV